jgi:hypothetical protein
MRTALFFTEDDASRKNRKKKNPVSEMGTEKREPSVSVGVCVCQKRERAEIPTKTREQDRETRN